MFLGRMKNIFMLGENVFNKQEEEELEKEEELYIRVHLSVLVLSLILSLENISSNYD